MKRENIFYLMFVLTILAIRTGIFIFPQRKLMIDGMTIHHFWIGIILILLVLLLPKKYATLRVVLLPIGFGIVADELTFIIFGDGTISSYWSTYSILGTITIIAGFFSIRKKLATKI